MSIDVFQLVAVRNTELSPILLYEVTDVGIEFKCNPYYSDDVNKKAEELVESIRPMINQSEFTNH